jgi:hypothetical protein
LWDFSPLEFASISEIRVSLSACSAFIAVRRVSPLDSVASQKVSGNDPRSVRTTALVLALPRCHSLRLWCFHGGGFFEGG